MIRTRTRTMLPRALLGAVLWLTVHLILRDPVDARRGREA
jgi:hypothetical protein